MRRSTWQTLWLGGTLVVAGGATRVPLVIDPPPGPRGEATVPWPVSTGVPFPRGALTDAEHCRLVDDEGHEAPLQSRVAATWDAERSSVRWLTIDFIARPGRRYALEFGPDVRRNGFSGSSKLAVNTVAKNATQTADSLVVRAGPLLVEFLRHGPSGLGRIGFDENGNGQFDSGEPIAAGRRDGEHAYIDQAGREFSSARDGDARVIHVDSSGPVRSCVRVDGFYTGPRGERIAAYRTRYHFFADLPLIKVVDEFRIVGSTKETRFRDISFELDLLGPANQLAANQLAANQLAASQLADNRVVTVDASGEPGNQLVERRWRAETRSVASYQRTFRHLGNLEHGNLEHNAAVVETTAQGSTPLAQPDRVGEWLQVADRHATVTGSLRWFWQQFPKEWEVTGDRLKLHFWSPRAGELDFGREGLRQFFGEQGTKYLLEWPGARGPLSPISRYFYFAGHTALEAGDADGLGINKHHEFYLHFERPGGRALGGEYARLAANPPLVLATGEWNCSTDVFGPLAPRTADPASRSPHEAIVDRLFDLGRAAQDDFGDYGWWLFGSGPHYSYQWDAATRRHYADPRRFEYHTYQKETQLWWNYFRSGERKFLEWALPSENHWVDIAVSHVPTTFRTEWLAGERVGEREGTEPATRRLHWPAGDWPIDSPLQYVRHHDTGEAWLRGASQFWATYHRTLETTTLAFYLTGDERFLDVIEFWRNYWGDLAGRTSASEFPPWHREQAWCRPGATIAGRPKTWAEMLRDYAPFASGSRHQQTLFFNLATLYEHTWDERIGQVLREYAAAFLDPAHRIGVWRSQDNGLPSNADAPHMAHYWSTALWKYARATRDPRLPDLLRRYYTAAYAADPYRGDVGVYSNQHLGFAYYFTRDPRHLPAIDAELALLAPNALPLAKPEDLGQRLYNPYAPIRSFAGVSRLAWALDAARRDGARPVVPPLRPQRTPIAVFKRPDVPLDLVLWGFDRQLSWQFLDEASGRRLRDVAEVAVLDVKTEQHASATQPFDRTLPQFEVFLHRVRIPATAPGGCYVLSPTLELGVLELHGSDTLYCDAARPLALHAEGPLTFVVPADLAELHFESAAAASVRVMQDGAERPVKVLGNRASLALTAADAGRTLRFENRSRDLVWLRLANVPAEHAWVAVSRAHPPAPATLLPSLAASRPERAQQLPDNPDRPFFVPGRFGQALNVVPERPVHLPDHVVAAGEKRRLFDEREGTIEFWIQRRWDERLNKLPRFAIVSNGLLDLVCPWKLPLGEWSHVAAVWRPYLHDPSQTAVHFYVNGLDEANYRNVKWDGYGDRPPGLFGKKWLEEFVLRVPPGAAFALDDLRVSSIARYADRTVDFGGQQTFNPVRFAPPTAPYAADEHTTLLFRFDGELVGTADRGRARVEGQGM